MESMTSITVFGASKFQEKYLMLCLVSYVVKVLQLMGNILAKNIH